MDKDFMQYVYAGVEKAIAGNAECTDLLSKCVEAQHNGNRELYDELSQQLSCRSEEACYIQGYKDAMRIMINSQQ